MIWFYNHQNEYLICYQQTGHRYFQNFHWVLFQFLQYLYPSWQILVSRRSQGHPRTSPKDPIWPSRGRREMTSRGGPDLTSLGRLKMTCRGRSDMTSKRRPWENDSERLQAFLRAFPRRPWKHVLGTMWEHMLDFPKFLFYWPNLSKSNSLFKVYLEPSRTSKMDLFFAKLVNGFQPLKIFIKELHRRNSNGF